MSLENRKVSNKNISNSFRGILRISPDNIGQDIGFIGMGETVISDSVGNESALSLGISSASVNGNFNISGTANITGNTNIIGNTNISGNSISIQSNDDTINLCGTDIDMSNPQDGDILYYEGNKLSYQSIEKFILGTIKKYNLSMVGHIMIWGSDDIPTGWLRCDGQILNQKDYPDLFSVIGFNFTDTNFINTAVEFSIPDFRGVFLRGTDRGRGLDYNYPNRGIGKFQDSAAPNIWGWFDGNTNDDNNPRPPHRKAGAFYSNGPSNIEGSDGDGYVGGLIGFDASRCSKVYKNDTREARPVNCSVDFIIKY